VLAVLVAAAPGAPAEVRIYPSAETLPANHLKFYLHFPEPMRQGVFLEHCRLLDDRGRAVSEPFRETELWSADGRRLTLWLHPGRQKTGVNLNVEFGPVLEPRRHYSLVISGQWPTDAGSPLGRDVVKRFRTGDRAAGQLDPASWKVEPPRKGTRDPLTVRFPSSLDHALLTRCLRIVTTNREDLSGKAHAGDEERAWHFTPEAPWSEGQYVLLADSVLEDLAGNSLARPFERDLEAPPPRATGPVVELRFDVR
jgi:hypothetical protein